MSNETSPPLSSQTGLVHLLITTKILRDGDLNLRNKWRVKICPIWVLYCLNFTIKPDLKMETPKLSLNLQLAPPETCNVCKRVPITGFRSLFKRPQPYFRNHVPISGTTSLFQGPGPYFVDHAPISETRTLFQRTGPYFREKVLIAETNSLFLRTRSLFWGPGPYFGDQGPIS